MQIDWYVFLSLSGEKELDLYDEFPTKSNIIDSEETLQVAITRITQTWSEWCENWDINCMGYKFNSIDLYLERFLRVSSLSKRMIWIDSSKVIG